MQSVTYRTENGVDNDPAGSYGEFIQKPSRLLRPRAETPLNWNPNNEHPILLYPLPNGVSVRMALTPYGSDFRAEASMRVGSHRKPWIHVLEHLMVHSDDIPNLDSQIARSVVNCDGYTNPHFLGYRLGIPRSDMGDLVRDNPQASSDTVFLLFSSMVRTSITDANLRRDRFRLSDEANIRGDDPVSRFYATALPMVALNEAFAKPTIEQELAYDVFALRQLHAQLPFNHTILEFSGNPGGRNLSTVADEILAASEGTFGVLPDKNGAGSKKPYNVEAFRNYGSRVSVEPAFDQRGNHFGFAVVTERTGNPKEDYAQRLFVHFLNNAFYQEMYGAGLLYRRHFSKSTFNDQDLTVHFVGMSTSQLGEAEKLSAKMWENIANGKADQKFEEAFSSAKAKDMGFLFNSPNLGRLDLALGLGLPTATNCASLYELITTVDFADVLQAGKMLSMSNRIGPVHYGPDDSLKTDYTRVTEADLMKRRDLAFA